MSKLIIAGSLLFEDYRLLEKSVYTFITKHRLTDIEIVSGCSYGADRLGEKFAAKYKFPIERFPANWPLHGLAAGPIRNMQMAQYANHCIVFWDGISKGTRSMIECAKEKKLVLKIVQY